MKAYAVTIEGETVNLVGLFYARSLEELAYMIDEVCSPRGSLYAEVQIGGGIVWPGNTLAPLDDADDEPTSRLTEAWAGIAADIMRGRKSPHIGPWLSFPAAIADDCLNLDKVNASIDRAMRRLAIADEIAEARP